MERIVLITGGATGIGKACAEKFAENGDIVIIHYNKSKNDALDLCEKLNKKTTADIVQANLEDVKEIAKMFNFIQKKYKKLDILVNNAGMSYEKFFADNTDAEILQMIQTNLTSAILCSKHALPFMLEHKLGSVINISSIYGIFGGSCESVYSATKAGLIGFTKALAREVGEANIRINCVAPGSVNTRMNKNFSKEEQQQFFANSAIKRMAEPKEIASAVFFLASEEASYVTGVILPIDGGYTCV